MLFLNEQVLNKGGFTMNLIYYNPDGTIRGIESGDYITKETVVKTIVLDYPDTKTVARLDMSTNPPTPILEDKEFVSHTVEELLNRVAQLEADRDSQIAAIAGLEVSQADQDDAIVELADIITEE